MNIIKIFDYFWLTHFVNPTDKIKKEELDEDYDDFYEEFDDDEDYDETRCDIISKKGV